uniref:Uncharacterized protein n=1 Tax=Arundo donax TaxID=35708 RepID=A0A0A9CAN8_ARUDO
MLKSYKPLGVLSFMFKMQFVDPAITFSYNAKEYPGPLCFI